MCTNKVNINYNMEAFNLLFNGFNDIMATYVRDLRSDNDFTNVTIVCNDHQEIKAHKVILSACSKFFRTILLKNPQQNPLIFLKGVNYSVLQALLDFIYLGQTKVEQNDLQVFLDIAKDLQINGLDDEMADILDSCEIEDLKNESYSQGIKTKDIQEIANDEETSIPRRVKSVWKDYGGAEIFQNEKYTNS